MPTGIYTRTKEHGQKISQSLKGHPNYYTAKGEDRYNWKGDDVGYQAMHVWIRKHWGKANKCESTNCPGVSVKYEWSNKNGVYTRDKTNWWMLCAGCHKRFDYTDAKKFKLSESAKKQPRANGRFSSIELLKEAK